MQEVSVLHVTVCELFIAVLLCNYEVKVMITVNQKAGLKNQTGLP